MIHPSKRVLLIASAALSGIGLLIAGCSGSGNGASSGGGVPAVEHGPAKAAAPFAGTASGSTGTGSSAVQLARLAPVQSIIYTADLTIGLRSEKAAVAASTAATNLVSAAGGYVASEQQTVPPGGGGTAQIILVLKVPVAQYPATLGRLAALGRRMAFDQQAQDVTQQVADVASRVASAQAAIRQLRALLARAGTVGDLLSVQNEIDAQESALESLLAQQQALTHETSYATVSMLIVGHHPVVRRKHEKAKSGFLAGLGSGWHAFVAALSWLLTALGTALPFVLLAALIGAAAYAGRRRFSRHGTPPSAEPPTAAPS